LNRIVARTRTSASPATFLRRSPQLGADKEPKLAFPILQAAAVSAKLNVSHGQGLDGFTQEGNLSISMSCNWHFSRSSVEWSSITKALKTRSLDKVETPSVPIVGFVVQHSILGALAANNPMIVVLGAHNVPNVHARS
jgi:hypothetical protein